MALTVSDVSRVIDEIAPAILGGSIQKIFQPAENAITLEMSKQQRTILLLKAAASSLSSSGEAIVSCA